MGGKVTFGKLKELGFSEGEIKVYLSLFKLGESSVGPISKESKVSHAKVYPILDKLIEKGLVSCIIKEGRKKFNANNPNMLLELLNKKVRDLEYNKKEIEKIIPSLLAKQKEEELQQYSRVFEGYRGVKGLFLELFTNDNKNEEIFVFGLNESLKEARMMSFFKFYHDLRKKNKIKVRLLLNKNIKRTIEKNYKDMIGNESIKYVNIKFPTGVFIFKDHVINIIADDKKITAFDLRSKINSEKYKEFFNDIWSNN
ncbi:hypothetical protein HN385_04490 [archaeon]|jgi:sugar-specific transcriptional regulator TrmB|nr:hypothetical protein [archaeon]MBT3451679.1 hypothetical protein [archaeon]MBT6869690.1 hypothetical protein [archaeon]MBT7193209.1 hypothetical protein [archaeon]MBT7380450.1 hypothetical protein [archaeon]